MTGLSAWLTAVCLAAVAGGVMQLLFPAGSTGRMLRWVTGLFTLGCLLLPLTGWEPPTLPEVTPPAAVDATLADRLAEAARKRVERQLLEAAEQAAAAEGARLVKFAAAVDSEGGWRIDIRQVQAVLRAADVDRVEGVRRRLAAWGDFDLRVTTEEGENGG